MAIPGKVTQSAGGILSYFTRHKTIANLLMVVTLVLGFWAMTQVRSQFFPDIVIDNVRVTVNWQGAGAEDVDNAIVAVIEPALLAVEGVESTQSTASEGRASMVLEFEPNWDMARAAEDVKAAVDSVSNLPENADDPTVRRGAWRDRVTNVVIHGPVAREQLGRYADEFVARLFREGVTRTSVNGVTDPIVRVTVPEASLIRNDISLSTLADVIGEEADADPAGDVAGGTARLRSGEQKRAAEDLGEIVIRSNSDGSKLRVSDVATIAVDGADTGRAYFVGENPAIEIRVDRAELGDAIEMQEIVERVSDEMMSSLPGGVQIELTRTRAELISARIWLLLTNGAQGLALVVGLLFLFLNARTAFWVAAGIPVAMFAAIALMFAAGLTINMISLFALIICLGIVVDDAIVVGEHADFRARKLKEGAVEASENAAIAMASPVFSATITTIIAFFGLTVISGRFGSLIADIPFTVTVVLIASLIECFLILPHHMSKSVGQTKEHWYDWPSRQFNKVFSAFRDRVFRPIMRLIIVFRYPVLATAVVGLAFMSTFVISGTVNWRFFNAPELGNFTGNVGMLPGATRQDTRDMVLEMQRAVDTVGARMEEKHGANPVTFSITQIGGTSGRGLSGQGTKEPDQLGSISVELIDADLRPYSSFAFLGEVQDEIRKHPLLETISFRSFRGGPGGDSLDVSLYGPSSDVLKRAAEALKTRLEPIGEITAVEDDMAYDKSELILELTPLGKSLGFSIDALGRELYSRLNGIDAAEFPVGLRTGKIVVELPETDLTANFINDTRIRSPEGQYVILSDIVSVRERLGFSQVIRENGLRRINITGSISEDIPERAVEITEQLRNEILPEISGEFGVEFQIGGLAEQEREFLSDATFGLYLCLLGIYLTLCWIFSSWVRPLVVMAIIPFGLVGTIWGHYLWDIPMSMFTVVGIIGMTGIIINDSIVLVTSIDKYADGRGLVPAVLDATVDRFRPVLLTTLTTVFGLAPLLYETSQQAQFLKPTVVTLVYGLAFGMFLVLLVVPSLVVVQQDVGRLFRALRRGLLGGHAARRQRLVMGSALFFALGLVTITFGGPAIQGEAFAPVVQVANVIGFSAGMTAWLILGVGLMAIFFIGLMATAALVRQRVVAAE